MQTYYIEADSLLHRLNPLTKVMATLPVLCFVALTTDPWTPATFIVFDVLVLLVVGKIPLGRFIRIAAPLSLLMLGFLLMYPLMIRSELTQGSPILLRIGPIAVTQAGVVYGLATGLRVYALICFSLVFSLTTDATDFIRALVQQWKLPYQIGYAALAAFRFVPMLHGELQIIQAAHRVRGIAAQGGLRGRYAQVQRYAVPLLATAIRQAERTALAMDGRGFGAFATRTYYRQMRFGVRDYLFVVGFWLMSVAIVLALWRAGLFGPLVLLHTV